MLLYHSVSERCDERFREWAVPPEQFAAHMAHLEAEGYTALTVGDYADRVFESAAALPDRPVVITFDDGFADFYDQAWPIMVRHGHTGTVFVATAYVGGTSAWLANLGERDRPMLTWAQIEELAAAGAECAAHGHEHLELDTVPAARAAADIAASKERLERAVGSVRSFAYPHGYYNDRLRREVARAGFTSACGVKHALTTATDDRYAIARLVVRNTDSVDRLQRMLAGQGVPVAPGPRRLRRAGWRAVRRAGAGPLLGGRRR